MKGKNKIQKQEKTLNIARRDFLKFAPATAAIGVLGAVTASKKAAAKVVEDKVKKATVKVSEDFPYEIRDDYKPLPSYSSVHGHAFFGGPLMAMGVDVDKEAFEQGNKFLHDINYAHDNDKPGFDQASKAMCGGSWALSNTTVGPSPGAVGDFGLFSWDNPSDKDPRALMDHNFVKKEKYQFKDKKEAANYIKRAATLYGADLVGITKRDEKWDYSVNFSPVPPMGRKMFPMPPQSLEEFQPMGKMMEEWTPDKWTYGWERAGFVPKSVVVVAFEMDYEAISTASTEVSAAAVGEGYSMMAKVSYQLAVMFRQLGYNAIPAGNDTGMSVPYAIAAGLGEGSRMGQLVTYKYGPRVRLAKVYTDFDFVEYDKPKTFGVFDFCKRCKLCADACPGKAISQDDEPSFEPTHEHKDNAYFNAKGIKKWYLDAKNCFKQWEDLGTDCTNCICACPYNKPDFWHHRLVDSVNKSMPGPVHSFMREMDKVFGYGNVDDLASLKKFYSPKGKSYDGF